jgi:hypothetical protein
MEGSLVAYKVFTNGSVLNASEINDNLMNQSVIVFSNAAARTSAITTPVEGQVTYLEDTNELSIYSGSAWVAIATSATNSYNLVQTLYYTSSGTFTKATYPWLRAMRVKVQGAGGGGGGAATTISGVVSVGSSGGAGAYAESFITNISGLSASETVTVGSSGAGGAAGNNAGSAGGTSSFGSLVSANGGNPGDGGSSITTPGILGSVNAQTTATGDLTIAGPGQSGFTFAIAGFLASVRGADSSLGTGGDAIFTGGGSNGNAGTGRGSGGSGGVNVQSQVTTRSGGNGAPGIVIVELYA